MKTSELWVLSPNIDKVTKFEFIRSFVKQQIENSNWIEGSALTDEVKQQWRTYREKLQAVHYDGNPDIIVLPDAPVTEGQPLPDPTSYSTFRSNIKDQAVTAITRLQQIQSVANPTNAQVIQAIKDMAAYEEKIIKIIVRMI